jgi:hypothetical protein
MTTGGPTVAASACNASGTATTTAASTGCPASASGRTQLASTTATTGSNEQAAEIGRAIHPRATTSATGRAGRSNAPDQYVERLAGRDGKIRNQPHASSAGG